MRFWYEFFLLFIIIIIINMQIAVFFIHYADLNDI
jgi:hypothetical protein